MTQRGSIQYLRTGEIDRKKWDACIREASNGLIYSYSFYLDHMADHWDGLVMGDYEMVMPLPWKKKYGITYLAQPFLTAQLGVFGQNIGQDVFSDFLYAVPKHFRYCDIYLNHSNVFPVEGFEIYQRSNYVLNLHHSYFELQSRYRENIRRNTKKSLEAGCRTARDLHVEKIIDLASRQMKSQTTESTEHIVRFRKLYYQLLKMEMAKTYGIVSARNELLASAVFFFSHGRAYYILVGNHPDGRTLGASHALIDAFILDHAGQPLLLDFEGSDLRNLAFFYSSFGAKEQKYAGLKWNRLPFYLKWVKG